MIEMFLILPNGTQPILNIEEHKEDFFIKDLKSPLTLLEIEYDTIDLYFNGQQVYKLKSSSISMENPLQVLNKFQDIQRAKIIIQEKNTEYNLIIENKQKKTVFDMLYELFCIQNIFFSTQFEIFNENTQIGLSDSLSHNSQSVYILKVPNELKLINVKLFGTKETAFDCSWNIQISDLKLLIKLYLKVKSDITIIKPTENTIIEDGTLDSNGIEEDDYIQVIKTDKNKFSYVLDKENRKEEKYTASI